MAVLLEELGAAQGPSRRCGLICEPGGEVAQLILLSMVAPLSQSKSPMKGRKHQPQNAAEPPPTF